MYDKPQYITADGFRRTNSNPSFASRRAAALNILEQKKKLADMKARSGRGISPEAAKLIAMAIKDMLKQR